MPRYSPWLGQINTNQNCLALEVDGERFLVRNNPVNRIGITIDGTHIGYAVRGIRASPIPLSMPPATRPSELAPENDRLINCDFHLFGAGNIDYIIVNETINSDQPFAPDKK